MTISMQFTWIVQNGSKISSIWAYKTPVHCYQQNSIGLNFLLLLFTGAWVLYMNMYDTLDMYKRELLYTDKYHTFSYNKTQAYSLIHINKYHTYSYKKTQAPVIYFYT